MKLIKKLFRRKARNCEFNLDLLNAVLPCFNSEFGVKFNTMSCKYNENSITASFTVLINFDPDEITKHRNDKITEYDYIKSKLNEKFKPMAVLSMPTADIQPTTNI